MALSSMSNYFNQNKSRFTFADCKLNNLNITNLNNGIVNMMYVKLASISSFGKTAYSGINR